MKRKIPIVPVAAVLLAVVFVAALALVIKPKHDEAGKLDEQIAVLDTQIEDTEKQLAAARQAAASGEGTGPKIEVADVFRLAKAMPDADDVPGVVLELDAIARGAGVDLQAITPQVTISVAGYRALPMQIVVDGGYFETADFLFRLRTLVNVRHGELDASGRLYTIDQLDVAEGAEGFPNVKAQLTLSAYAYGAGSVLGGGPAPAPAAGAETGATTSETPGVTESGDATESGDGTDQAALGGGS